MSQLKTLIIDDNPSDRTLALRELKKLFPQLQYQEIIDEASFSAALIKNDFNLVVTDYQLLWTTGLKLFYRIREHRPDCPVIMFTGTGSEEIAVKAMKAGLDDYVIKTSKHYVRLAAAVRSAWQRSQQKEALEEFKESYYRFFERVPLGLYRLNPLGEIIEANSTLVKMLGYPSYQDLRGKNLDDYHLDGESYLRWLRQLKQDDAIEEFEGQIESISGKIVWVRHNAIAVKDVEDNVACYEGAIADVTASKQAELERVELLSRERKARQEAETANRIKEEFLATLSHELRTPLNAIMGWMQLLQGGQLNQAQIDKALDVISRNAKAQNQLIEDLLDVSRITRGTTKLELEPVNLISVVSSALDTVTPGAKAKNIQIVTQFDVEKIMVNGDEKRLQQIFWNLLINAVKFTPAKGTVVISSKIEQDKALVEVRDTGQGIASDVLPHVFERFRQAETKSSTRTKGGLGLGLSIVRHLVEIHGGEVMVDSEGLNRGAAFTVTLPLL